MTNGKIIIVAGERDWPIFRSQIVEREIEAQMSSRADAVFVGDCKTGVDRIAREYIGRNGWERRFFLADWDKYGTKAGPIRNGEMVKAAAEEASLVTDHLMKASPNAICLAFWSGRRHRSGTLDCISQATALGIPVRIVPRGT